MAERDQQIILIAAVAEKNRVIGHGLDLPWHLPADLKRFKRLTLGLPLVMGRRTFEAIIQQFGGLLPDRRHIVLTTRGPIAEYPDVETVSSIPEVLELLKDEPVIYIGGGGTVYEQFLPLATKMELTLVEGNYDGDTYFPPFQHLVGDQFEVVGDESQDGFRFVTYERVCGP